MTDIGKSRGFTLLEVLVAMAIFSLMIVMMGNIFHNSSIAWDSGTRKAQGAIQARVILAGMAKELSHAVQIQDDALELYSGDDAWESAWEKSSVRFISLGSQRDILEDDGLRDAHLIKYSVDDGKLSRERSIIKEFSLYTEDDYVPCVIELPEVLAEGVSRIYFKTPKLAAPSGGLSDGLARHPIEALPRWVTITLEMDRTDSLSGLAAVSAGPDGVFDPTGPDTDDLKTY